MPAHAHSCDGFKPTDKLTLQVVVDEDTEEITRIQVTSLGYSFHTFWQCNPRIATCLNVEHDEQLVCSYGRVALVLSDCVGFTKHHKFTFVQHNDTSDKEVDSFLPLFIDFTDRTTAAFEDIIADVHYMNCQTEYQLHQLLKTTKNLIPSETLQALTSTATGAVAVGDGLMSAACKKQPLKIGKYLKKCKGSVASRPLFCYLNGALARQLGYDNVVWPQLNHWEIEQPHSLKYFTFGSLPGENITSFVFQDYQLLPYLGNALPLVAHVGHTSLNLSLPPYADLWIHNAPNEFTSDYVDHLLYISISYLSFIKHFQNNTFSSSQPLNNPGDGHSKLLELFNDILRTVLWQILSYMFGNVAQYVALIAMLCALLHGLLLPIKVIRLLINKLGDV